MHLLRNGLAVGTKKLGIADALPGTRYRLYDGDVFFALAEVKEDGDARTLSPLRQFDI